MQACPECGAGRAPLLPLGGIFWCSAVTEVDSQHQAGSSWLAPAAVCRITIHSHNSHCHNTRFLPLHPQWLPKQQPAKRAAREELLATRSVKTSSRLWYVLAAPLSTTSSCPASDDMTEVLMSPPLCVYRSLPTVSKTGSSPSPSRNQECVDLADPSIPFASSEMSLTSLATVPASAGQRTLDRIHPRVPRHERRSGCLHLLRRAP